jgi:hypothetical protein
LMLLGRWFGSLASIASQQANAAKQKVHMGMLHATLVLSPTPLTCAAVQAVCMVGA